MIESIEFSNFKALRNTTLPLAPFTLLLGPNGSGKSTVLQALHDAAIGAAEQAKIARHDPQVPRLTWPSVLSVTANETESAANRIQLRHGDQVYVVSRIWNSNLVDGVWDFKFEDGRQVPSKPIPLLNWLARMQTYSLQADEIAKHSPVTSRPLQSNGAGLAAVLDDLKDNYPERWEMLLAEMREWLPEFDYILFNKPADGSKGIVLRTKIGGHRIPAGDLSQGTLIALALLTLAYLPEPPSLIGLEEIDRGLHPRLLRHLQDALYRLSYPQSCGESRPQIQVIATTHSPYLLDLYRDRPEEVVLAEKKGLEVEMKRLCDIEHYTEIIGDSPLSDVWYSGVLGGVSVRP